MPLRSVRLAGDTGVPRRLGRLGARPPVVVLIIEGVEAGQPLLVRARLDLADERVRATSWR